MWHAADEALLARLLDEQVMEKLARAERHGRAQPPERARGMISLLQQREGGAAAVEAAHLGDLRLLQELVHPICFAGTSPELLHHLALFHAGTACALAVDSEHERHAVKAQVASMSAWFALGKEQTYLRELAQEVAGKELNPVAIAQAARAAPWEALDGVGRTAGRGARALEPAAKVALLALGRAEEISQRAGLDPGEAALVAQRAEGLMAAALDEALAPSLAGLSEAKARGNAMEGGEAHLERAVVVWRWSDHDEAVERFVVEQAVPLAWDHYRSSGWTGLQRLLDVVMPLVERLAERIIDDPSRLAYAGPCAQLLVFQAEAGRDLLKQLAMAERALLICPKHRNGRIVLANLLCERVIQMASSKPCEREQLCRDLERAEALHPRARRLGDARVALARWPGARA